MNRPQRQTDLQVNIFTNLHNQAEFISLIFFYNVDTIGLARVSKRQNK